MGVGTVKYSRSSESSIYCNFHSPVFAAVDVDVVYPCLGPKEVFPDNIRDKALYGKPSASTREFSIAKRHRIRIGL